MQTEIKIYRIAIRLDKDGYSFTIQAYKAQETNKAYKFAGYLIKKSLLNKIETNYHNYGSFMSYYTWSLGTHVQANKDFLLQRCVEQINYLKETTETMHMGLAINNGHRISENW